MEFGKSKKRIQYYYEMDGVKSKKSKEEVDLGVTVTANFTPDRHTDKITGDDEFVKKSKNGILIFG